MWSPANAGTLLRAIYVKIIAVRIAPIPPHRRHTFATGRDAGVAAMCVDQRELVLDDFVTNAAGAVPIWKASPKARRICSTQRSPASIGPDAVFYDWGTGLDHPWWRRQLEIIAAMWGRATA
jgi:hypothetical protein